MSSSSYRSLSSELAQRIEEFEVALRADPGADFHQVLPPVDHPIYLPLLGELIRIDLEYSWTGGRGKRLSEFTARYPVVLEQPIVLRAVAFEEYRQRRRAGQDIRPAEYRDAYGLDTSDWPEFPLGSEYRSENWLLGAIEARTDPAQTPPPTSLALIAGPEEWNTGRVSIRPIKRSPEQDDSLAVSRWQEATESLPAPGETFLGFRLIEELGRGAFGRVYLARQGDLAGRPVALKVACDIADESQTLAQMQHTNIVPIYSFHRVGQFQAVCMPYFGSTTLAHVVRHISDRATLPCSGKELRGTLYSAKGQSATAIQSSAKEAAKSHPGTPAFAVPAAAISAEQPPTPDGWSRLEGLTYIEVILTLGSQLADGLAHAHRRGILHRDLKPANILFTDDGRPMLLDFNLAEDMKQRHATERAAVGGTLPYMSPEQIEAYRSATGRLDERCDIYSLGVILFELLTGRHPFPLYKTYSRDAVLKMIADRQKPPPRLQPYNAAISPAVEAIVRKCLASNPAERFKKAEDLREDIDNHLGQRPLKHAANPSRKELFRKWVKRHPRLTSSGTVAAVAVVLLLGVLAGAVYARERTRGLEARGRLADHQTAFREVQVFLDDRNVSLPRLDEGLAKLQGVLTRYSVPSEADASETWLNSAALRYLPDADRTRVKEDIGETYYLMAQVAFVKALATTDARERAAQCDQATRWNELARRFGEGRLPRAVREQRATIAEIRGNQSEAERLRREAETIPLESARDLFLVGSQLSRQNRHRDALKHLGRATDLDPENFSAWFVRGSSHIALEQYEFATMCFGSCISLRPDSAPAWTNRGLAFAGLRFRNHALNDFARALQLDPNATEAFFQRAEVLRAEGNLAGAEEDYTRAIATGVAPARVYFLRSTVRHFRGNMDGKEADREAGFRVRPADEVNWIAWAENRMEKHPQDALGDVEEALKLNPMSIHGLELKAHLLAERLNRPEESLAVLNRSVELHPDHVRGIAGRGVVLARAGNREAALRDAQDALRRDWRAPNLYQVACIYALTSKTNPDDRREALRLIWDSLRTGFGLDIVHTDTDLDALRNEQEFKDIVKDAEVLHGPRRALVPEKK